MYPKQMLKLMDKKILAIFLLSHGEQWLCLQCVRLGIKMMAGGDSLESFCYVREQDTLSIA